MGFGDNFHIIDDKAFTEDNVLVYNIFVCNLTRKTSRRQIVEYFTLFGTVVNARILFQRNHNRSKQAFVNFEDPRDAAKVLKNSNHTINKRRLRILACDSWHQPDGQHGCLETGVRCSNQDFLLLKLNDYCLEMIFGLLNISDQVNFSRCDWRLKDIFLMHARSQYKTLQLEIVGLLTLWQSRLFFEMVGCHIEKLMGRVPPKMVLKCVGNYCTNLKSIKFHNDVLFGCRMQLAPDDLSKLLKKSYLITELELNNVYLTDECIPILEKLRNLKHLSLAMNYELTGRNIKALTNLEKLSLNNCRGIQSTFFQEICQHLIELNSLDMQNCSLLETGDLRAMAKHLRGLETLKTSCDNVEIDCLGLLPNLKNLQLLAERHVSTPNFSPLAIHLGDQLELLEVPAFNRFNLENATSIAKFKNLNVLICAGSRGLDDKCLEQLSQLRHLKEINLKNCNSFTDEGLLHLIRKCSHLQSLNVTGCSQLSNVFAKKVLNLLIVERKQKGLKRQLKIKASFSRISDFTLSTSELDSDRDLPNILFEYNWN